MKLKSEEIKKTPFGYCHLCEKEIDDDGNLFCSKCRKKDWKKRFGVIKILSETSKHNWKLKGFKK